MYVFASVGGDTGSSTYASGRYAPTLTPAGGTLAASAPDEWTWTRIGRIVHVEGVVELTWPGYVAGTVAQDLKISAPAGLPVNAGAGFGPGGLAVGSEEADLNVVFMSIPFEDGLDIGVSAQTKTGLKIFAGVSVQYFV